MMRVVMTTKMNLQVNEEVSRDMTGEADGMNQGVVINSTHSSMRKKFLIELLIQIKYLF